MTEPYIEDFRKFNSNTGAGANDPDSMIMNALSHFSYHMSNGTELMCDLQGGKQNM